MTSPNYLKGSRPLRVPLQVAQDLRDNLRELGELQKFLDTADGAQLAGALETAEREKTEYLSVEVRVVNLFKDFLVTRQLSARSTMAANVIGPCPGPDPYTCPYAR